MISRDGDWLDQCLLRMPSSWREVVTQLAPSNPTQCFIDPPPVDGVVRLFDELEDITLRILVLRIAGGKLVREVAQELNLSEGRVRRAEYVGLAKLGAEAERGGINLQDWLRQVGHKEAAVVRFQTFSIPLRPKVVLLVIEAWLIVSAALASCRRDFDIVDLHDGRHAVVRRLGNPAPRIHKVLSDLRGFVPVSVLAEETGFPRDFLSNIASSLSGVLFTHSEEFISSNLLLRDYFLAVATWLAHHGIGAFTLDQLRAVIDYALPHRYSGGSQTGTLESDEVGVWFEEVSPGSFRVKPEDQMVHFKLRGFPMPFTFAGVLFSLRSSGKPEGRESADSLRDNGAAADSEIFLPNSTQVSAQVDVDAALDERVLWFMSGTDEPKTAHQIAGAIGGERREVLRVLLTLRQEGRVSTADGRSYWSTGKV